MPRKADDQEYQTQAAQTNAETQDASVEFAEESTSPNFAADTQAQATQTNTDPFAKNAQNMTQADTEFAQMQDSGMTGVVNNSDGQVKDPTNNLETYTATANQNNTVQAPEVGQ